MVERDRLALPGKRQQSLAVKVYSIGGRLMVDSKTRQRWRRPEKDVRRVCDRKRRKVRDAIVVCTASCVSAPVTGDKADGQGVRQSWVQNSVEANGKWQETARE